MLPTGRPTERMLHLQAIVDRTGGDTLPDWPEPTNEDYILIAQYIVLFSYVDMNLRRLVEVLELAGNLPKPIKGKVADLRIGEVEELLLAAPDLSEPNRIALENIREYRKMRNLLAHFAVKRFPNEDAFVFLTKSARDYRREFGKEPAPGMLFTAVIDVPQLRAAISEIKRLQHWLAQGVAQLETLYFSAASSAQQA